LSSPDNCESDEDELMNIIEDSDDGEEVSIESGGKLVTCESFSGIQYV